MRDMVSKWSVTCQKFGQFLSQVFTEFTDKKVVSCLNKNSLWVWGLIIGVVSAPANAMDRLEVSQKIQSQRIQEVQRWLSLTETGRVLLEKAQYYKIPIQVGKVSKTDLTATRVNDAQGERFEFRSTIYLSAEKDAVFQALDLAHELTHALNPNTNPFDPQLTAQEYVKRGIESKGGEAQAIVNECRVGKELVTATRTSLKKETSELIKARCQVVWNKSSDEASWKETFYQMGHHYHEFLNRVAQLKVTDQETKSWAKKIQAKSPLFSSAVSKKPYPLALLEEYIDITQSICAKIDSSFLGRSIASVQLLKNRCQSVSAD